MVEPVWYPDIELSRTMELFAAFDLIRKAQINFNLEDYKKIFGDHVGEHIWYQEGSSLIIIWQSGLTTEQKKSLCNYIIKKYRPVVKEDE